ncbi:MAG TPA: aspartate aminotransferase family protein [Micropepsaceae bacterium]|nr:aspartate aminotransferase family protein [Micropepsaceae bacterium]
MIPPLLPTYNRADIAFERGEGPYLFDEKGERYLDFGSGIAVSALGHAHPQLVAALREQAGKLWHTSNLYRVPAQERLAKRLIEASFADTVFFANSGAEAVECAIKMARRFHYASGAPERYRLVTFEGAFHGRTLATIAAGGSAKYLEGFGPKVEGFDSVPFGDFDAVVRATGPETAGILVEPIQGEVGVRVPPAGFLKRLREFCDARGLLLVFDEVQTGIGRTGRLFAYEELGLVPDIMAVGKGIGGGFPLGACLASERAAKGMTVGSHGSTYGGNPLAMAAGNAVLDVVLEPGFLDRVRKISGSMQQHLAMLAAEHANVIAEVRGRGLLLGLRLHVPAAAFIARLRESRLLGVGATENVVRLLPPLNIEERHVKEAMAALVTACAGFETERKAV